MFGGPLLQDCDIFHGQELEERREGNRGKSGRWLSVRVMDEAVGRAAALMGCPRNPQKQRCLKGLAFPAGENEQHMAQVCPAVAP